MPRPTGLLKEIVPGENDDNLRRLLSSPASGRTRGRTQSLATQASDSPSNSPPSTNLPQSTFADSPTRLGRAATKSTPTKSNGKDQTHPSSSRAPPTPAPKSVAESAIADSSANPAGSMSSQRSRLGRNNARGGSPQENIAQQIWSDFYRNHLMGVKESEIRTKQVADKIVELEKRVQRDKEAGNKASVADMEALQNLYREQVKIGEDLAAKITHEGMTTTLQMLIEIKKREEEQAAEKSRTSNSRGSGIDFDGPSDSPVPSPADNRQIKKLGTSRTGSQPPNRPEGTPSEASERPSKPKIVYAQNEEVAFKRKTPAKPEEQDWILGKVSRVIGEGKSRRYEVEDPFPDTTNPGPVMYKSSASQMVPIPPEGAPLEDYEIGKRVLALYPDTTTFYRAEVKAMLNGGKEVQLLFEDEAAGELKVVTRRLVLDHKG